MNKIALILLLTLTAFMMLQSCASDNEDDRFGDMLVCDTTAVSYASTIAPIMETSCALSGCHVAGGTVGGIFNNYAGVKDGVDNREMFNRVVLEQDMPPLSALSACNISLIESWINQGALDN